MADTKQKTYYVREDLARVLAMIASMDDRRESEVINEAIDYYVNIKLNAEQRRVFGYKEQTNGRGTSKGNGSSSAATVQSGSARDANGSGPVSPSRIKKRNRKPNGAGHRST
jgi:predicted transcriptional regulator